MDENKYGWAVRYSRGKRWLRVAMVFDGGSLICEQVDDKCDATLFGTKTFAKYVGVQMEDTFCDSGSTTIHRVRLIALAKRRSNGGG